MDKAQRDAIRARVEAATPGEWEWFDDGYKYHLVTDESQVEGIIETDYGQARKEDRTFIAHARQDVPALLQEIERLEAENAKLREVGSDFIDILNNELDEKIDAERTALFKGA